MAGRRHGGNRILKSQQEELKMDGSQIPKNVAGVDASAESGYTKARGGDGSKINVAKAERWLSGALGAGLIYLGIRRRSWPGTLLALAGGNLVLRGALGRSLIYQAFGINTADKMKAVKQATATGNFKVEKSIAVDRSPEEVYRFWRNFENLPRVMKHLK